MKTFKWLFFVLVITAVLMIHPTAMVQAETITLSGTVTNYQDQPIANVTIEILDSNTGLLVSSTLTNSSGSYSIDVPCCWPYDIQAIPPEGSGYGTSTELYKIFTENTIIDIKSPPFQFIDSGQRFENTWWSRAELGDFNRDGYLDVVIISLEGTRIWLNNNGNFILQQEFLDLKEHLYFWGTPVIADFNNDENLDIILGTAQYMHFLKGDSTGNFSYEGQINNSLSNTDGLTAGDIDGDGNIDLVHVPVDTGSPRSMRVLLNDGHANFSDTGNLYSVPTYGYIKPILGNINSNEDEFLDILLIGSWDDPGQVWLNDGSGNFTLHQEINFVGAAYGGALGDLDDDGDLDAFIGIGTHHKFNQVLFNDGNGNFTDSGQEIGYDVNATWDIELVDLDHDGDLDAIFSNDANFYRNQIWFNDGSGYFFDSKQYLGRDVSRCVHVGDLDFDGDLDAFFCDGGSPTVWFNQAASTPPDRDGDGIPDDQDNAPDHFNPDQSDIDGDGFGDVADPCPNDASNTCDADGSAAIYIVNADGGTLATADGSVKIIFPPNSMTGEGGSVSITDTDDGSTGFELTSNHGKVLGVFSVDLQPSQSFNPPLIVTFSWEDEDGIVVGTNIHEENLIVTKDNVVYVDKCKFVPDDGDPPDCNMVANTFTFEVDSWSEFALAYANDPVVTSIATPTDPVNIQNLPTIVGAFTDADDDDSHTAVWNWGDGKSSVGIVDQANNLVSGTPNYTEAGVYVVELIVTDTFPNSGSLSSNFMVVYDPNGGFVTGGGWIDSPAGAYTPDPTLAGKATFGFVSKYKKGATVPEGNTEFQFRVADLNFKSTSYDWLVVAGDTAKFKGVGTINGLGEYKFQIWAGDGEPDTFRIKIWTEDEFGVESVVYDNGTQQSLGGGSIVVHDK